MGIPAAGLWALLAFVTNYIPNVGFIIGLIPPAILGLLVGGPSLAIAVIAVYCVLNFIIQSVLQPKFVGDAVGLTTTVSFLSLIVWAYILGPIGAILAIPASLLVKASAGRHGSAGPVARPVPGRQAGLQGQATQGSEEPRRQGVDAGSGGRIGVTDGTWQPGRSRSTCRSSIRPRRTTRGGGRVSRSGRIPPAPGGSTRVTGNPTCRASSASTTCGWAPPGRLRQTWRKAMG